MTNVLQFGQPMTTPEDVREAGPGQAAEAESVMAPQETIAPTAVEPAQPSGPETSDGPPEMPPGRCRECGAAVPRDEIEQRDGKPPMHRERKSRHDLVGSLCGPVVTSWMYHVTFVGLDGKLHAARLPLAMEIERGNALGVATYLLSDVAPGDEDPPLVEVLWWKLLAMACLVLSLSLPAWAGQVTNASRRGTNIAWIMHSTPVTCAAHHRAIEAIYGTRPKQCLYCGALHLGKTWWRRWRLTTAKDRRSI